ncbi:MAG: hypothetical protein IJZ44_01900 [Lachnospiraceae bacterium]|nr:hypothetical protein [Lachnospiraceae bacterium]
MRKSEYEYEAKIKVTTITKLMVFVGISGLILANMPSEKFVAQYAILENILQCVETIASALFSAGLVSVIVEISTIKNLVSDAFVKILEGEFPVDGLSKETLHKIDKRVAATITNMPEGKIDDTVYRYERHLLELVSSKYYAYHNFTYHIIPDEKNNCFLVKVKINYKMVNENMMDNTFDLRMKLYNLQENMTVEECVDLLDVKEVVINNKPVELDNIISAEPVRHETESSTYYDYKVRLFKELSNKKNTIRAEFSYKVPLHDICQAFRVSTPCKELEHKFYIEPDIQTGEEWIIKANAYSTFYHNQSDENSNYKVVQDTDTSLIIRYKDWALVGNGYCVFYQKKSMN